MKVNVKKLADNAKLPVYGSEFAAGADLYASEATVIGAGETGFVHTGIAVELPAGTVGLVYARSGMACKQDLAPANKVGVIDAAKLWSRSIITARRRVRWKRATALRSLW